MAGAGAWFSGKALVEHAQESPRCTQSRCDAAEKWCCPLRSEPKRDVDRDTDGVRK